MDIPNFKKEQELWDKGYKVIGIDEVGRGALSGPMYIGAVSFTNVKNTYLSRKIMEMGIDDSKQLTPLRREMLFEEIKKHAEISECVAVHSETIDRYGLTQAMNLGVRDLISTIMGKLFKKEKLYLLIDAFRMPGIPGVLDNQEGIIRGDCTSVSIAAASIVAKVSRDNLMKEYANEYPGYGWERNKGYGTKDHYKAIAKLGISTLHRRLFLRKYLRSTSS